MKRLLPLLLLLPPTAAAAHGGEAHGGWRPEMWAILPLLLLAALYALGFARLWRRSDQGRPALGRAGLTFAAGWAVLAGAVASPLHQAGEHSFALHMVEHELIMLPAALLLVLARPGPVLLWAFSGRARGGLAALTRSARPLWDWLALPVTATFLQSAALWIWHMPALFDRALDGEGWHIAQHMSFLATALLFWWAMARGRAGRAGYGLVALCLFVTTLVGGALGALMAFSTSPWYAGYAALGMTPTGLTPAEDQQLAGLIMWIPGGIFHAAAALYFLYQWLKASEVPHAVAAE
jgi:cytochrome c oxidase assembly factor CtaG